MDSLADPDALLEADGDRLALALAEEDLLSLADPDFDSDEDGLRDALADADALAEAETPLDPALTLNESIPPLYIEPVPV